MHVLVELGIFLFLLFAGLGILLVGVALLKWGESLKDRAQNDARRD